MTIENELIEETPESVEVTETETPEQEKLFNSEQVSKIVARERKKAMEKARMEYEQQQQSQEAPQEAPQSAPVESPQQGSLTPEQMQQMMQEQMPGLMEKEQARLQHEQVVNSFVNKMQAAEEKYPGLEGELNQLNFRDPSTSALVVMANNLENTGDIMKDLLDNPEKFSNVLSLIQSQPNLAMKRLYDLSSSIKTNQEALEEAKQAKSPLNQLKPSVNAQDSGATTVSDFRKMKW